MKEQVRAVTAQQQEYKNSAPLNASNNRELNNNLNQGQPRVPFTGMKQNTGTKRVQSDTRQGERTCYACGQKGPFKLQCQQNNEVMCYRCRQKYHFQWRCIMRCEYLNK